MDNLQAHLEKIGKVIRNLNSIGSSEISSLNIERQKESKNYIEHQFNFSGYYSIRYESAIALRIKNSELDELIESWLDKLKDKIHATKENPTYGGKWVEIKPNEEKRAEAREDLKYLYDNLPLKKQRKQAGKLLGYSRLKIGCNELLREIV